ncbi:MAG TPA: patatin-like phospholipase family protein [Trueperaceae bacterium]|nr:patatin-like phospholipase family protein [Trueperaceae bacterium]
MERPGRHNCVGLVLSGGGARGFAHIGVLRVLERAGAKFDVVAGTSMGAVLGALYAAGKSPDEIYDIALNTGWRDVVDISLQAGLIKGDRLEAFLASHLPRSFADLKLPFAVTTTDIENGEDVLITEGDLIKAVRASISFPGAIEPIQYLGRTLADGGIVNNLPVSAATVLGAQPHRRIRRHGRQAVGLPHAQRRGELVGADGRDREAGAAQPDAPDVVAQQRHHAVDTRRHQRQPPPTRSAHPHEHASVPRRVVQGFRGHRGDR